MCGLLPRTSIYAPIIMGGRYRYAQSLPMDKICIMIFKGRRLRELKCSVDYLLYEALKVPLKLFRKIFAEGIRY